MVHAAYLMLLFPLAGFLFLVAFGRRIGDPAAGWVGTIAVGGAFVVACIVLAGLIGLPADHRVVVHNYFTWFQSGGLSVPVGTLVDPLSMTMCMFVTGVSALIHLYSIGYMKGDRDYSKFFIYMNLFVFSMLLLVLGDNLLLTFVGWEGVGVCSYWLVAFWFQRESAASAGKKAFIYNRIGDAGFLLAIFLIFEKTGTIQYESGPGGGIFGQLSHLGGGTATAAVLLLFLAATGKSAQIPLFNWLPDAMEGPTPVSALIHAATMVTAGVYLLCRMNPLLHLTTPGMEVIASIGAVTAFVAATIACAQQDIKKVLAFSTVSQIGYMVLAVGTGAYIAAIFLMVMHAFFKGLLFLGAGSVIHGLEDEQDLKRMGALRRYMKWTTVTFTIGFLAIAGIPPLSGFWAKGDVLDNVFAHYKVLWVIGLVTAVLTAYYMSRLEVLAFGGEPRFDKPGPHGESPHHAPHESPWIMRIPLVDPRLLRLLRRGARPALGPHAQPRELADPGVQWHALRRQPGRRVPVGAGPDRHRGGGDRRDRGRLAVAGCGGGQAGAGAAVPAAGLVLGRLLRRRHRAAGPAAGHVLRLGGGRPRDRRCRQRHRAPGQGHRHRGAQAADGVRPQLRAGDRPGHGPRSSPSC